MTRRAVLTVLVAMLPAVAAFALAGWSFRQHNSVTVDEIAYLTAAKPIFQRGDFGQLAEYGTAPLPLLLEYGPAVWVHGDGIADEQWVSSPGDPAAVDLARVTTTWVVGVPLLGLVVGWAYARTGSGWAVAWAGLLAAACPMLLAHATLATTDACFALSLPLAVVALARHADRPTAGRFAVAALVCGLAVASKYTALLVFPAGYLVGLLADVRAGRGPLLLRGLVTHPLRQLGLLAVACGVVWASTGFAVSPKPMLAADPDQPAASPLARFLETTRLPVPVEGVFSQVEQTTRKDRSAYFTRLHGESYANGHKGYYLHALLYKSTPAEWVLAAGAVAAGVVGLIGRRRADTVTVAAAVALLLLAVVTSVSSKQLGLRYWLPLYPVGFVFAADALARLAAARRKPAVVLGLLLLAGQWAAAGAAHPWQVAYINPLFGGPPRAAELLGNGDADWQQGWKELKRHLDADGESAALVFTPRPADLHVYGIRTLPWRAYPTPPCRFLVVPGMTHSLNPAMTPRVVPLLGLTAKPVVLAGGVWVYDLSDPEVWAAYRLALLEPDFTP